MERLTAEDTEHMLNLGLNGASKRVTPEDVAGRLVERGHAVRRIGGLVLTDAGWMALKRGHD